MNPNRIDNTEFTKLLGQWKTEGTILRDLHKPAQKFSGTDTYELILDGFYILHRADVLMGDVRSETVELIGFDESTQQAYFEYYNNYGVSGKMTGHLEDNELEIIGDDLRFDGWLSKNYDTLTGVWDRFEDNNWIRFLEIKLTKIG